MWTWALLRIAVVNTWPVCMSAKYTLQHALQGGAAVSRGVDLEEPGFGFDLVAGGAQHDRVPQQRPGLVAAFPQIGSRCFTGAKYRSIVAADIATSSARTPALILTLARYQCAFGFHRVEPVGHRRCKVLSATTA